MQYLLNTERVFHSPMSMMHYCWPEESQERALDAGEAESDEAEGARTMEGTATPAAKP